MVRYRYICRCKRILTGKNAICKRCLIDFWCSIWNDVRERKKQENARIEAGLTQEKAAEKIDVSRQTISNWENEKSYPDIISVIALSDLYSVSLDELLKGDQKMAEHLEESTNVVKSNKKLTGAILLNIILMILLIALNMLLPEGTYYLVIVFCVVIMSSSALLYQIIKRI